MTTTELTTLRKEVGTQAEVADLLGVSKRTIERAENDESYWARRVVALALERLRDLAEKEPTDS